MRFNTISEHQILSITWNELNNMIERTIRTLSWHPNDQIAKNKLEELNAQAEEINARLVQLEMDDTQPEMIWR